MFLAPLSEVRKPMILRQFLHQNPVGISYLFGCGAKLKTLPDYVEVLPGACTGSVCSRQLSGKPWSTIGFEKRHNEACRSEDEAEFIRFMLADIPLAPPEATALRAANSGLAAAAA
jgi:hypothetical protein